MIRLNGEQVSPVVGTVVAFQTDERWRVGRVAWGGKSGLRIAPSGGGKGHKVRRLEVLL